MTKLVDPSRIESIVGVSRRQIDHVARCVSSEKQVYILHSQRCLNTGRDLRECPFSRALDTGLDPAWKDHLDRPVCVAIKDGFLYPAEDATPADDEKAGA